MNDNKTEKDMEPPKYVSYELVSSETESLNTDEMQIVFPTRSTQSEIKQFYSITDKKYPHDKIVTIKDLNQGNESSFVKLIEGDFNGNFYIAGLKPITIEHTQPYIEPEQSYHFDFIFMVLYPFLALMLILGLIKKYRKKK